MGCGTALRFAKQREADREAKSDTVQPTTTTHRRLYRDTNA